MSGKYRATWILQCVVWSGRRVGSNPTLFIPLAATVRAPGTLTL